MLDKHRVKRYIFALLVIMLTVLHSLIYLVSAVSLLGGFHREDFSVYIFLFLLMLVIVIAIRIMGYRKISITLLVFLILLGLVLARGYIILFYFTDNVYSLIC